MKKSLIFAHPFLFSIYPVLFLYSKNFKEYREGSIVVPLIFSLIFGTLVFFISKLIFKKVEESAIVASFVIFVSLSFGRLLDLTGLKDITIGSITIDAQFTFTAILAVLLYILIRLIKKYEKGLRPANEYLVFLSLFLLVFPLFSIISFEAQTGRVFQPQKKEEVRVTKKATANKNLPDIYYFIFDRYAGPKSLSTQYSVDNSKFFDFLKDKGFYVASEASTNYPKTFLSLGSSLNMEYLDFLTKQTNGGHSEDQSLATPLIRNSKVLNYLKDKGYYTVNIGPRTWTPTSVNPYADKNYVMTDGTYPLVDPFGTGFLNTTITEPIFKRLFHNPLDVSVDPNNNEHRRLEVFELGAIDDAIKIPGPKFVFMHILIPHDPFVFNQNCQPINEVEVNKHDQVTNYINQLKCANTKIERIMNEIIAHNKNSVIILQSDEGPFPMKAPINENENWGTASVDSYHEKFPILDAYYFPGKDAEASGLYQSITPVNSFKVLFNTYFGENYPLLPDRNYVFYDNQNYYKFTDVTDKLKD
ncbi:MAG TPA: hypothetical protein VG917_03655 [Patescibacteria group bacterium]|nr:hypothetical protein [Patescibacteria group bacterium]